MSAGSRKVVVEFEGLNGVVDAGTGKEVAEAIADVTPSSHNPYNG